MWHSKWISILKLYKNCFRFSFFSSFVDSKHKRLHANAVFFNRLDVALQIGRSFEFKICSYAAAQIGANFREVLDGTLLNECRCTGQMARNIIDQASLCIGIQNLIIENSCLWEIIFVSAADAINIAGNLFWWRKFASAFALLWPSKWVWIIIWSTALVVSKAHSTIALIVSGWHAIWTIDWQLQMVWSQTMTMCVRVWE